MEVKRFLRVFLWIAPFAVIFVGIGIYSHFHLEDVYLNARVERSFTTLDVTNNSEIDWIECVATLHDEEFQSPTFNVRVGERYQIPFSAFIAKDGMRFDDTRFAPKLVKIECGPRGKRQYNMFSVD